MLAILDAERYRFSIKNALMMTFPLFLALALRIDNVVLTFATASIVSMGTVGDSLHKSLIRALSVLFGVAISVSLLAIMPQDTHLFLLFTAVIISLLAYLSVANKYNGYLFIAMVISVAMVWTNSFNGEIDHTFYYIISRLESTIIGILGFMAVAILFWPKTNFKPMLNAQTSILKAQQEIAKAIFSQTRESTLTYEKQERNLIKTYNTTLRSAIYDSWQAIVNKKAYLAKSVHFTAIKNTLSALALLHDVLHQTHGSVIVNLDEINSRITMLFDALIAKKTLTPEPILPILKDNLKNDDKIKTFFAIYKTQIAELERSLRALRACEETIAGVKPDMKKKIYLPKKRLYNDWIWLDRDALSAAIRVFIVFSSTMAIWFSGAVQNPFFVTISIILVVMVNVYSPYKPQSMMVPINTGFLCALVFGFFMNDISTFYALLFLVFSYLFLTAFVINNAGFLALFYLGFFFLPFSQVQSEFNPADILGAMLLFNTVLLVSIFTKYFPNAMRPEKKFLNYRCLFFTFAIKHLSLHDRYKGSQKPMGLLMALRYRYYINHLAITLEKMQEAFANLDFTYYKHIDKQSIQKLFTQMEQYVLVVNALDDNDNSMPLLHVTPSKALKLFKQQLVTLLHEFESGKKSETEITDIFDSRCIIESLYTLFKNEGKILNDLDRSNMLKRTAIYSHLYNTALSLKEPLESIDFGSLNRRKF